MKKRWIFVVALWVVALSHSHADELTPAQARTLVHAIVERLKQEKALFPVLTQLQSGHYSDMPGTSANFDEGFLCKNNVTYREFKSEPDKPQPQAAGYDTVNPGGIKFFVHAARHRALTASTKDYPFSPDLDGPLLYYFISTNPEDPKLKRAVQACVEKELRTSGLWSGRH